MNARTRPLHRRIAPNPVAAKLPPKLRCMRPLSPEERFVRGKPLSDRDALAELYECASLPVGVRLLFGRVLDRLDAAEALSLAIERRLTMAEARLYTDAQHGEEEGPL
jgi:hypothetical protein